MIGKLSEYIDHEAFVKSLSDTISQHEQIIVDLFVSNQCNLHCKHCYFLDYKPIGTPLTLQKWYDIINNCIDVGIKHFHISGKEPFCDQRILSIIEHLNKLASIHDLKYGLVTNGTLLSTEYLQELLNSNMSYIEFSLEGDIEYNLKIRGKNSYESIYSLINEVSDKKKINITSTYFGDNLHNIKQMFDKYINIGITKFNIAPYQKYDSNNLLPLDELSYIKMIDLIIYFRHYLEEKKEQPIDIRICVSRRHAYDMFINNNILTSDINQFLFNQKKIVYKLGDNILEVNYPLLYIPYLPQIIITNDGMIIPCADDIHYKKVYEISLGNIIDHDMNYILSKRKDYIYNFINQQLKNE